MTRPASIIQDCPFCGESENLILLDGGIERPVITDVDVLKDSSGNEVWQMVDAAGCEVCATMAPLDVWNRTVPARVFAILRDFDPPEGEIAA